MKTAKAAVIGAGSTYTPEIIEGFVQRLDSLPFETFALMDIDEKRLEIVGGLAERMLRAGGFGGEILLTTDRDRAIDGADYVFGQIRVGGMAARIRDEKIPLKYGLLGQETTGAGGFMNALRTVPVITELAREMERRAPDAWLINFSNPSGIVAEAVLNHTKTKMLGLCNGPINMLAAIESMLGHGNFDYEYVGLNHLSWITSVTAEGEDMLAQLKNGTGARLKNIPELPFDRELLEAVPGIPISYLSYYYKRDAQLKHCMEAEQTRGEVCVELERGLMTQYAARELTVKPPELEKRGGALYSTAAVSLVDAMENDKHELHVADVKNHGALPFLADDDVVEVKCEVGRDGLRPIPVQTYTPYMVGLIQAVKAYERLTVSAALSGSRADALAALMVHPLIGDYDKASAVLADMLEANRDYLPAFF